jgi:NADP-dependent 3-hydroxy acid dehydrogenase YdfG
MKGFTQPHIKTKALDVCDEEAVNRVSAEIIKEAGRIDIVVRV